MKYTSFEKETLIEALELLFDKRGLNYLPQDDNGTYYPQNPDAPDEETPWDEPYDAKTANTISSLIEKLSE